MGVPTCRHNHRRRGNRRSHNALEKIMTANCPKCASVVLPHHVCKVCGTYNSHTVLPVEKRAQKVLAKEAAAEQTASVKK